MQIASIGLMWGGDLAVLLLLTHLSGKSLHNLLETLGDLFFYGLTYDLLDICWLRGRYLMIVEGRALERR
jgi:hypothetical protein